MKDDRKQAARIIDDRFYRLLARAVDTYKSFSKSLEVRGCTFRFCVFVYLFAY